MRRRRVKRSAAVPQAMAGLPTGQLWEELGRQLADPALEGDAEFFRWLRGVQPTLVLATEDRAVAGFGTSGASKRARQSFMAWNGVETPEAQLHCVQNVLEEVLEYLAAAHSRLGPRRLPGPQVEAAQWESAAVAGAAVAAQPSAQRRKEPLDAAAGHFVVKEPTGSQLAEDGYAAQWEVGQQPWRGRAAPLAAKLVCLNVWRSLQKALGARGSDLPPQEQALASELRWSTELLARERRRSSEASQRAKDAKVVELAAEVCGVSSSSLRQWFTQYRSGELGAPAAAGRPAISAEGRRALFPELAAWAEAFLTEEASRGQGATWGELASAALEAEDFRRELAAQVLRADGHEEHVEDVGDADSTQRLLQRLGLTAPGPSGDEGRLHDRATNFLKRALGSMGFSHAEIVRDAVQALQSKVGWTLGFSQWYFRWLTSPQDLGISEKTPQTSDSGCEEPQMRGLCMQRATRV
jgi:hypothetical protein